MDRAEAWFHLLLALAVGTVVYITMFGAHWPTASLSQYSLPWAGAPHILLGGGAN
jgi:hypothetical protein